MIFEITISFGYSSNLISSKGKIAGNGDKFDRSISEWNQMYVDIKYNPYN